MQRLQSLLSLLEPNDIEKRNNHFSTIDWNSDLARERERRRTLTKLTGFDGILSRIWDLIIDAILLIFIGSLLGLIAGFIDISEMWVVHLSRGFKINKGFVYQSFI
jgi:hypothetical protein